MNKKRIVFISALGIAGIILFMGVVDSLYVIIMHHIGYDFRVVRSNEDIGIPSNNDKYRLVEMSDETGQYLLYSVIQLESLDDDDFSDYPKTVYVTSDFWYHSRFSVDYGWIDGSSDFYINSSDSGTHRYFFNGDTWIPDH